MKFDHTKHGVEQFPYDLKVLGKMISFRKADPRTFQGIIPSKIQLQLLGIDDLDRATGKA